jgi:hypothetical protein
MRETHQQARGSSRKRRAKEPPKGVNPKISRTQKKKNAWLPSSSLLFALMVDC